MQVNYTLPALQPPVTRQPQLPAPAEMSFRSRLGRLSARAFVSWKQLLRLDLAPADAVHIGPPPKPSSMELRDAADTRQRWKNLLASHRGADSPPEVQRMLALLGRMQQIEDALISRNVSESRG